MDHKLKTYLIYTYGCSMNYSDTERICALLDSYGLQEVGDQTQADIVIFNTCTIKKKAEDKVFGVFTQLGKIKKKFPYKKFGITGCMVKKTGVRDKKSDIYSNDPLFLRSKYIDFVFRILDTPKLPDILNLDENNSEALGFTESKLDFFNLKQKFSSPFQAIIPIQTGCDNFCSYCVVPNTRGREYSRPLEDVLREVKYVAKKGAKEIMLVGQNVNSYGKGSVNTKRKWDKENSKWFDGDEKTPFTFLLDQISDIEGIERIRFQSSNPHDMSDDIIEVMTGNSKIMPNLHLALQSGNDEILKKMKRRHGTQDYRLIVDKIRKEDPVFGITTDIIVGFPGETEEAFEDTLKIINEMKFDMIYISQYSPRKGTYSGDKMIDDVDDQIKSKRWHIVNDLLIKVIGERFDTFIGTKAKVLIEKIENNLAQGKTEHNIVCRFESGNYKIGDVVDIKIVGKAKWSLEGEV